MNRDKCLDLISHILQKNMAIAVSRDKNNYDCFQVMPDHDMEEEDFFDWYIWQDLDKQFFPTPFEAVVECLKFRYKWLEFREAKLPNNTKMD